MREEKRDRMLKVLTTTLAIALIASLSWGAYEHAMLQEYKIETENQYKRALNDLVVDLDEAENSMTKAKVANSPNQKALYMSETWKAAEMAVKNVSQLPADEVGLSFVDVFLNQVGDFSKQMTKKVASIETMSPQEEKTFNDMHEQVILVNRTTQELLNQVHTQNLAWVDKPPSLLQKLGFGKNNAIQTAAEGDEQDGESEGLDRDNEPLDADKADPENKDQKQKEERDVLQKPTTSVRSGLTQLDTSLQKYPPFNYKGDLDKHYVKKPLGLPPGQINESKAISVAKNFLKIIGIKNPNPEVTGMSQGPMAGYLLKFDDIYMEVAKQGGVVTVFRDQREVDGRKLDPKQALQKASATVKALGFANLEVTATEDFGSYVHVDNVATMAGTRLYPDKIRLLVATDNGQVIGYDATPYYAYHHARDLSPMLSLAEARAKVDPNLKIIESRLAVIAKAGTEEAFCYEFHGNAYGEEYLVYINAKDGSEEKISRIINSPRGKLIQ